MSNHAGWIQTFSGKKFSFLDLESNIIDIVDIAHALSNTCRFTGHVREFYSVAQHSCLVHDNMPEDLGALGRAYGLLHDASEAYLVDLPRPLKLMPELAGYKVIEKAVQGRIYRRFRIDEREPPALKDVDVRALVTERLWLMAKSEHRWEDPMFDEALERRFTKPIFPVAPVVAQHEFLRRFNALEKEGVIRR